MSCAIFITLQGDKTNNQKSTSVSRKAMSLQEENIPYYGLFGSNLPPRSFASSESSAGGSPTNGNKDAKKAQDLQNIVMRSNVYNENDPVVKMIREQRSRSSMK